MRERLSVCVFDRSHLLLEISKQIHLKIKQRHLEVLQEVIFLISLHHTITLKPQVYTNPQMDGYMDRGHISFYSAKHLVCHETDFANKIF